ncbi:chromosomal replication initiator protein DnaA [Trueperella pyogenes]|uniref:chromosomal replication initiator protein DnaA n=1 Tax=Trueperella pyogenes TaxID=1661 RepID=UPI0024BFF0A4|nr:chromosomal replication initiator protein DnaA [Trueperella pyogenes]WHU58480.1 chromosomal replication initiator protein DnaA [Trueperella pyogenes]
MDVSPARDAWTAASELLRSQGKLSDSQAAFIRLAHPLATVEDIFMIGVGSEFVKNWIAEHIAAVMEDQLSAILGRSVRLVISVDPSLTEQTTQSAPQWHQPERVLHVVEDPVQSPDSFHTNDFSAADPFQAADHSVLPPHEPDFRIPAKPRLVEDVEPEDRELSMHASLGAMLPRIEINQDQSDAHLNPRYTFDNFVIGESNRFAHATALAVAEAPGSTYNPLFLYSDSGMGKTHLLHAIGNYYLSLFPGSKVLYTSSEEFTNMFINAMMKKEGHNFKNLFRSVDILLIDDIQFLSNKEGTLEEFFNTFNALATANKQIVITSDVAPRLLEGFEERMISRFASGIVANIDLPNLETRIAILEKKAASEKFMVPREVLEFIASRVTTNVREMEGSLRRVTAYAGLFNMPVTLDVAESALKDMMSDPSSVTVTAGLIMNQVSTYFGITAGDLKSPTRTRSLTQPRHIAMYMCREMTDLSLPKIAEAFNRRDHTTVLNALRKIESLMTEKQEIFNQVTELTSRIKQAAKEQAQLADNH